MNKNANELKDYIDEWDSNRNLLSNVYNHEELLTDPKFLTSAVLKMLKDYREYLDKHGSVVRTDTHTTYTSVTAELLKWTTYSDCGDTISYCRIDACNYDGLWLFQNTLNYPSGQELSQAEVLDFCKNSTTE